MTVFTKPFNICDKPAIINYVERNTDTEVQLEIPVDDLVPRDTVSTSKPVLKGVIIFGLLLLLAACTYDTYQKLSKADTYQAYCGVPVPRNFIERKSNGHYRVLPVTWSSKPILRVVSTMDEPKSDEIMDILNEELDIGDSVEKISVIDNGRRVNFIHDFSDNITGIVDEKRCFMMDLQSDIVMAPELFIAGLTAGDQFDVSKVRTHLRAVLPAIDDIAKIAHKMAETCFARPVYRLYRNEVVIEKRSANTEPHDYIQFSGKHVQEIKIENIAEILNFEETLNKKKN